MNREIVRCGSYSYRVYAKKRDPHGVVWDAFYDLFDEDGNNLLRGENIVTTLDVLTSEVEACRLAEVEARAKILGVMGGVGATYEV